MKPLQRGADCPELDELLGASPESGVGRHLRTCPSCQNEVAMFGSFEAAVPTGKEAEDLRFVLDRMKQGAVPRAVQAPAPTLWERLRGAWSPLWVGGFATAAAAVVLFVSLSGQLRTVPAPAAGDGSTWRSGASPLRIESPVGDVERVPGAIRWTAVPAAARYAVSLSEIDGTRVFYKIVPKIELDLDGEAATLLRTGKVYYIRIVAEDAAGRPLAEAGPEQIRVVARRSQ